MKKHRPAHRRAKKEIGFPAAVFSGAAFSVALGMALLALSCIPALSLSDPLRFVPIFSLVCLFVSAAAGAYLAARMHGKSGLVCGLLSSLALIMILVVIACILSLKIKTSLFFICVPAILLVSAIAGVCGVSASEPKMPKHKSFRPR